MNESEWMRRIDARLAEGNEIMRENRQAFEENRKAFQENRKAFQENQQFMHELLLRFDKAMERSDRRWKATLAESERRWNKAWEDLLNRYFGPNGSGPGSDPGPDPA